MTTPTEPLRRDPLADIRDAASALADAREHREPRGHTWDSNRNKKTLDPHKTIIPGLIQQLRDLAEPGSGSDSPGARSAPESRPPGNLEAVSLLASIELGVGRKQVEYRDLFRAYPQLLRTLERRDNAESNMRGLVGVADALDYNRQDDLARELKSWRRQAAILCRWEDGAVELVAPCPAELDSGRLCGARGSLRVSATTEAAWCKTCAALWEPDQTGSLFEHVRRHAEATRRQADAAKAQVRARKAAVREAEGQAREARNEARGAA